MVLVDGFFVFSRHVTHPKCNAKTSWFEYGRSAIIDMTAGRDDTNVDLFIHLPWSPEGTGVIFNSVTVPGFLMSFMWSLLLISLLFLFDEPLRINAGDVANGDSSNSRHKGQKLGWFVNSTGTFFQVIFRNGAFPVSMDLYHTLLPQFSFF